MVVSQEERTLGGLAHLGVIFGWVGLAFQVILLIVYMPKSKYVTSHVKQALGLWVIWYLARLAVGALLGGVGVTAAFNPAILFSGSFIGGMLLGALVMMALGIGVLVLVILAMVKGFGGQLHRYPIIGDLVASIAGE
ncbi:MAG TPA: DUF4870 domain-containing protein [Symbiobacteriaceae bacterium]|nr:DUF4870 domain-containing protein [Symbiobacteriaceae bacterium]